MTKLNDKRTRLRLPENEDGEGNSVHPAGAANTARAASISFPGTSSSFPIGTTAPKAAAAVRVGVPGTSSLVPSTSSSVPNANVAPKPAAASKRTVAPNLLLLEENFRLVLFSLLFSLGHFYIACRNLLTFYFVHFSGWKELCISSKVT
jgi:hypothetical protein